MDPRIPPLLAELLAAQYGDALAGELLASFPARRPVTLRVNTLRSSRGETAAALDSAGIAHRDVPWYADAMILPGADETAVRALPLYDGGAVYLQSLSAMVPALLMDLTPGHSVLDMCAAPGGKTTQMAALSGGRVSITACERDAVRAQRLRFNLERQGVRQANVMNVDARRLDSLFRFDAVLLDAPCTGSGTLLLSDDAPPRRMTADWVQKTVRTQEALLAKGLSLLAPGGILVYSTCSILGRENEDVLRRVVPDAGGELVPVDPGRFPGLPLLPVSLPGTLCIRPDALHEGFFAAVVRRRK